MTPILPGLQATGAIELACYVCTMGAALLTFLCTLRF